VSEKYEFIDAQYADAPADGGNAPTITCMCRWLGVSKSGFYEWRSRPESATAKRREELKLLIAKAFGDSDGTYGYRRIWSQLARWGVRAGQELVRALMRELGLVACQPRPWRPSTTKQGQAGPIPDLVGRDFSAAAPGEKMVGDITYIPTWEGWVYLASVIDCATRKCAGWAMGDNYKTPLITAAIEMASRNLDLPEGAVFHSDRGSSVPSWTSEHRSAGDEGVPMPSPPGPQPRISGRIMTCPSFCRHRRPC
jgi:putative transposase